MIFLIVVGSIYGDYKKGKVEREYQDISKIAIVQGNYSGLDKMKFGKFDEMLTSYNELSKSIVDNSVDLVVWPESSIPIFFDREEKDFRSIKKFNTTPLLFGTHTIEKVRYKNKEREQIYNSLVLLSKNGEKLDHYDKRKLLMFVEGFEPSF